MPSSMTTTLVPRQRHYRVKRGDSLWWIAERQYGDPLVWPEISRANHLIDRDMLLVGMSLRLPDIAPWELPRTAGWSGSGSLRHVNPGLTDNPGATARHHAGSGAATMPRGGLAPARVVRIPAVTLTINRLVIVQHTPLYDAEMSYKGQITFKPQDSIGQIDIANGKVTASLEGKNSDFSVDSSGQISGTLKSEYQSDLEKMGSQYHYSYNPTTHELQISAGFSWGNARIGSNEVEFKPPSTIIYTSKPRDVEGEFKGVHYKGKIEFQFKLTVRPLDGTLAPQPVREPAPFRIRIPAPSPGVVGEVVVGTVFVCGIIFLPEFTVPALAAAAM